MEQVVKAIEAGMITTFKWHLDRYLDRKVLEGYVLGASKDQAQFFVPFFLKNIRNIPKQIKMNFF